eukprot:362190-Chlamydomonas_euryale.AAC.1
MPRRRGRVGKGGQGRVGKARRGRRKDSNKGWGRGEGKQAAFVRRTLSGLFLRSRMVRASSTTRCMRSTLFWMRSSPSRAAAAAGKAQKCTDGGAAASSSGRHRRRF